MAKVVDEVLIYAPENIFLKSHKLSIPNLLSVIFIKRTNASKYFAFIFFSMSVTEKVSMRMI